MDVTLLLCTDLDRTLLPNGLQPESPAARQHYERVAQRADVIVVWVSGRDRGLIEEARERWALPVPAYVVADVGTTIYETGGEASGDLWRSLSAWHDAIAPDWGGLDRQAIHALLRPLPGLQLQPEDRQKQFKLSYFPPYVGDDPAARAERGELDEQMERILTDHDVRAARIWSDDETSETGLLDVLPASATKIHAVRFLQSRIGVDAQRVLYAGDSGNDLPALVSEIPGVLVANALESVREEALRQATAAGTVDALYCARGGYRGMNGNYAAGLVEGIAHFFPELLGDVP